MGTYFFTAAREGFEPPEAFTPQTLSRRPHSAALPPRQIVLKTIKRKVTREFNGSETRLMA